MLHFENGVPFRVELRADGHFHCAAYPGHFSYKLNSEANTVAIEWGKYGRRGANPNPHPSPSLSANPNPVLP